MSQQVRRLLNDASSKDETCLPELCVPCWWTIKPQFEKQLVLPPHPCSPQHLSQWLLMKREMLAYYQQPYLRPLPCTAHGSFEAVPFLSKRELPPRASSQQGIRRRAASPGLLS